MRARSSKARSSASGRLRRAIRIVLTSRTGSPGSVARVRARGRTSTAFGSTSTSVPAGSRVARSSAATRLTEVQRTGAVRSPASWAAAVGSGPIRLHSECTVTIVGTPRRAAAATSGAVNGATTETCACSTSYDASSATDTSRRDRTRCTCDGAGVVAVPPVGGRTAGGHDGDVVAAAGLPLGERGHVPLDASQHRRVVVADVQHPHVAAPVAVRVRARSHQAQPPSSTPPTGISRAKTKTR